MMDFPDQNYRKAYRLSERIFRFKSRELSEFYKRLGVSFDLCPAFCNRIFWDLCLPKVEYKQQVKQRLNLEQDKIGILIYQRYTRFSLKMLLSSVLSMLRFTGWLAGAMVRNRKGMIFVEGFILQDNRFRLLHERLALGDKSNLLRIFESGSSPFVYLPWPHRSLLRLLKNKCVENVGAYRFWMIAIRLLKPSKIIILDDSGNKTYSLVLAAKLSGVEVIGLSHGQLPPIQPFAYGFKDYSMINPLLFDKYYVWDTLFQKAMRKQGYLYNKQIYVCGWLQQIYSLVDYSKSKKKYVLYALEHFVCNRAKVFEYLQELVMCYGYQVIVKTRPQDNKRFTSLYPSMTVVDQFSQEHLDHAFCAVGTGSSMMYELSSAGIPLLSPEFLPDYEFNLGMPIHFRSFSITDIEDENFELFKKADVSNKFIDEFLCE